MAQSILSYYQMKSLQYLKVLMKLVLMNLNNLDSIGKKMSRWFKYRFSRAYLKMPNCSSFVDESKLFEDQRFALRIIKLVAHNPTSEIHIAPMSERFYLKHRANVYIIIDRNNISISDSSHHYDVRNTDVLHAFLIKFLTRILENRLARLEHETLNMLNHGLHTMLEKFSSKNFKVSKIDTPPSKLKQVFDLVKN